MIKLLVLGSLEVMCAKDIAVVTIGVVRIGVGGGRCGCRCCGRKL